MEHEKGYNDQPIQQPAEDHFGTDNFSRALAGSIQKMGNPYGSVVALNGPWGSGKSSAANLVLHHLQPDIDAGRLVVIKFACWWFRGEEALALAFFRELYAGLAPSVSERFKKVLPKLGSRLLRAGAMVGPAIDMAGGGGAGNIAAGAMQWLSDLVEQDESVEKLHAQLSEALREQPRRFLIVIDDIDRLSPDEALLVFRLVKSVGRLPNVIYLLVYDRTLAERVISERFPSEGPHYLEKIVQAAFELPEPQPADLCNQLLQAIHDICGEPPEERIVRFMNLFYEIVAPEMKTPRDVIRLANTISVTWPSVDGEVDLGDFVALETLRLLQPQLYRAIRQNKAKLCEKNGWPDNQRMLAAEFDQLLLQSIADHSRERYRRGTMRLFPLLESVWNNTVYSSHDQWARERRVCSKAHFDAYFRFSLGDDALRASEIESLIKRADDREFIASTLVAALQVTRRNGGTKAALILDELMLHADTVPTESIRPLLTAIFKVADQLDVPDDKAGAFSVGDNSLRIHWLLRRLTLGRFTLPERSALFAAACVEAPLGWLSDFSTSASRQHYPREGKEPAPESECLMTIADAEVLREKLLARIVDASLSGELLKHPDLSSLLYQWRHCAKDDGATVRAWTEVQLASDDAVVAFASAFSSYSWSQVVGDLVAKRSVRAQVSGLDKIVNVDRFKSRLEEIEKQQGELVPDALKLFLTAWRSQDEGGEQ